MLAPLHSLHLSLMFVPQHSLHWHLWRWCGQMFVPPHSWHCSFGAGAGRSSPPRTPCIYSFCAGAGRRCAASSSRRLLPLRQPLRASAAYCCCRPPMWQARRASRLPLRSPVRRPRARRPTRPFLKRPAYRCCRPPTWQERRASARSLFGQTARTGGTFTGRARACRPAPWPFCPARRQPRPGLRGSGPIHERCRSATGEVEVRKELARAASAWPPRTSPLLLCGPTLLAFWRGCR
jgi:hypothetical protein